MTKTRENRGGYREGSGRKPIFELGEKERRQIIKDVTEKAKESGTSFGSELGEIMFGKSGIKEPGFRPCDFMPRTFYRRFQNETLLRRLF